MPRAPLSEGLRSVSLKIGSKVKVVNPGSDFYERTGLVVDIDMAHSLPYGVDMGMGAPTPFKGWQLMEIDAFEDWANRPGTEDPF